MIKLGYYKFGHIDHESGAMADEGIVHVDGEHVSVVDDHAGYLATIIPDGSVGMEEGEHIMRSINMNQYSRFVYIGDKEEDIAEHYNPVNASPELEKGIKDMMAGAMMGIAGAGGMLYAPSATNQSAVSSPSVPVSRASSDSEIVDNLARIESSGGKNVIHGMTGDSVHTDIQRAVGHTGNLPSSVIEESAKNPYLKNTDIGQGVRRIAGLEGFATGNTYNTRSYIEKTPAKEKSKHYAKINKITQNPENDRKITEARIKNHRDIFSELTKDPHELELLIAHAHHNYYLNTKKIFRKHGIKGIINHAGAEGNYVKKYAETLPDGHPTKNLFNKHYKKKFFKKSIAEDYELEDLQKSTKQYKEMLGDVTQHKEAFDVAKKMPNSNWGTWVIRNYKQNPEKFHSLKEEIVNHAGLHENLEYSGVRFDKENDFDHGIGMLRDANKKFEERFSKDTHIMVPQGEKKIMDAGDGMAWFSAGKSWCPREAKAMGHCGNEPSARPFHDLFSLRTVHKVNGKEYHEPHVTFILDKENNTFGEMKGRTNKKPTNRYHNAIAQLLARGYVPFGGGHAPAEDFHIDDLSPELKKFVAEKNIRAFINSSDPELSAKALEASMGRS